MSSAPTRRHLWMTSLLVALCFLASGCATTATDSRPQSEASRDDSDFFGDDDADIASPRIKPTPPQPPPEPVIDLRGLKRALKLSAPLEKLGYREKGFNSCQVGYGYSPTQNCRSLTLIAIHFRLQCRESEGTIESLQNYELRDITSRDMRWTIGNLTGTTETNGQGYGEILLVAPRSLRRQSLRLTRDEHFVGFTAGEVTRIIAPADWCY